MLPFQYILIIDDDPYLRRSLAMILQRAGYGVTLAASAREARHWLQVEVYNLVVLDLTLPDADGLPLLGEAHAHQADVPVFILTGHATLESATEAVRQGPRDYLVKPVQPENLLARVREVLAEQPCRRRREIVLQLEELLGKLHTLDGLSAQRASGASKPPHPPAAASARYLQRGNLILDLGTRRISVGSQQLFLQPLTFDYLVTLTRHAPDIVSYETLVEESQGYHLSPSEARILARGRMAQLRKALEPDRHHPEFVITVRGIGYRLVVG
jgi:DNA-binding response OmpR family regulator